MKKRRILFVLLCLYIVHNCMDIANTDNTSGSSMADANGLDDDSTGIGHPISERRNEMSNQSMYIMGSPSYILKAEKYVAPAFTQANYSTYTEADAGNQNIEANVTAELKDANNTNTTSENNHELLAMASIPDIVGSKKNSSNTVLQENYNNSSNTMNGPNATFDASDPGGPIIPPVDTIPPDNTGGGGDPGGPVDPPPDTPLDGGLALLLAVAIGKGAKSLRNYRKSKPENVHELFV